MNNGTTPVQSDNSAGAAVYSKKILFIYDVLVLGIANSFAWLCPTRKQLAFYNKYISANHLDVGVGTGYYLDKCSYPTAKPNIQLLDLNINSLTAASERIKRYQPETQVADILQPLTINLPKFDSIAVNYLLHCLPGENLFAKEMVFKNLAPLLNEGGVLFGATILGKNIKPNFLANKFLTFHNEKNIFSNLNDSITDLETILARNFKQYTLEQIGCVALFSGSNF